MKIMGLSNVSRFYVACVLLLFVSCSDNVQVLHAVSVAEDIGLVGEWELINLTSSISSENTYLGSDDIDYGNFPEKSFMVFNGDGTFLATIYNESPNNEEVTRSKLTGSYTVNGGNISLLTNVSDQEQDQFSGTFKISEKYLELALQDKFTENDSIFVVSTISNMVRID